MSRDYFRPLPEVDGRHILAGGWLRFSRLERLRRGTPAVIMGVSDAPAETLARLTQPRPPVMGLPMDRARVVGIVNATPDSFSDGGAYDPVEQGRSLLKQGADLLDIGAESTRPGATELSEDIEIARLSSVLTTLRGARFSVDTRKAAVAKHAISLGAGMVNDVSGLAFDKNMAHAVAGSGVPICLMHAQGVPADMQHAPNYDDVVLDVYDALEARIRRAEDSGIARGSIVVDPGIGFGKTTEHNLALLARIGVFHGLGCAILLGVSRKRFIGEIGGAPNPSDRGPGTLALTLAATAQGVQIHRVHDVASAVQGLALWAAVTQRT